MIARTLRKLGFIIWVIGMVLTFFWYANIFTFLIWFTGMCINFYFDVENEKRRARIVQEGQ